MGKNGLKESDNVKLQNEEFISEVGSRYQEDLLDFDMSNDCLDHFFGKFLNSLDKYKDLWKLMQIIFVMPNGQAQIERGFSVSNEMVIENWEAGSLHIFFCKKNVYKKISLKNPKLLSKR